MTVTVPAEPRYFSAPAWQYSTPPFAGFVVGTVVASRIPITPTPPPKAPTSDANCVFERKRSPCASPASDPSSWNGRCWAESVISRDRKWYALVIWGRRRPAVDARPLRHVVGQDGAAAREVVHRRR